MTTAWHDKRVYLQIRPLTNPAWVKELEYLSANTLFEIEITAEVCTIATTVDYAARTCAYWYDQYATGQVRRKILDRIMFIANRYIPSEFGCKKVNFLTLSSPDYAALLAVDTFDVTDQESKHGSARDGSRVSREARDSGDAGSNQTT